MKRHAGNYRPISILSQVNKFIEGQVCKEMDIHLEERKILNDNQWGFRKGKSTEGLLLSLTEKRKQELDEGKVVGVLFLDFRKAFDSVDRETLKKKLLACGFSGDIYDWLEDYLANRRQFVNVNGTESDIKTITYGVPQGSLLGLRLFSIHVNDLPEFVKAGILLMFADDTTIYCIGNHVEEVVDKLSKALSELYDWCVRN